MIRLKDNTFSANKKSTLSNEKGVLCSRRYTPSRRYNSFVPTSLIRRLSFDEMVDASSLFDSVINGASEVNLSTVSPNVRNLVKLTKTQYPHLMDRIYKDLNKRIVSTNHRLFYAKPESEELYLRLMDSKPLSDKSQVLSDHIVVRGINK